MTATKTQNRGNAPRDRNADKAAVLGSLKPGVPVSAPCWRALAVALGLEGMPSSAFKRAVNSLYYGGRQSGTPPIILSRSGGIWGDLGTRPVQVVRVMT